MPTSHRRIAIIRDEEVERALRVARDARPGAGSDASVARNLILRGAEELERENGGDDPFDEWLRANGGTPARGSLKEWIEERGPLPPYDPDDPYPAQRALEETREERLP
jgi:hypothetical protein